MQVYNLTSKMAPSWDRVQQVTLEVESLLNHKPFNIAKMFHLEEALRTKVNQALIHRWLVKTAVSSHNWLNISNNRIPIVVRPVAQILLQRTEQTLHAIVIRCSTILKSTTWLIWRTLGFRVFIKAREGQIWIHNCLVTISNNLRRI
jgi:hypothetical protein